MASFKLIWIIYSADVYFSFATDISIISSDQTRIWQGISPANSFHFPEHLNWRITCNSVSSPFTVKVMSDTSNGESGTVDDDLTNPNKRDNEKKRRDQENLYLEELSQLISVNLPEIRYRVSHRAWKQGCIIFRINITTLLGENYFMGRGGIALNMLWYMVSK